MCPLAGVSSVSGRPGCRVLGVFTGEIFLFHFARLGLLGTVIGIMNSFQDIGKMGNANLATVAPGIGGALVATAAGHPGMALRCPPLKEAYA